MSLTRQTPDLTDYLLLVSLALLFGLSFAFTRVAVAELPPLTIASGRLLLAFLMLYPLMRLRGQKMPPAGRVWLAIFAAGFFGNALPFTLISWGQMRVEAGLTAIFMAIMPLATVLLAHVFTHDEKLTRWKVIGVLFGLVGVIVLMGVSALNAVGEDLLRQGAILASALSYSVNALITRKLTHLPRWSTMTALMFASSILLVPACLLFDSPWQLRPSWEALSALIALAIGPTAIATVMILVIISRQGVSFLSQINFMVPVFGMIAGVLMLGERLPANAYFALGFIMAGVAISRLRSPVGSTA
ncbi:DMT family transporter [Granulosicoccus antarcticus]|uniref:Putative amino-acid metabolite efflux pump n=1 Tax=Granulosicoccus antarcticus IMCC3135 TaxID=1192854 RepID=A0A2Z2NYX5_9GAMM|nr:DMT family transporter [Granulosicoccus antarcticus]ASJ76656.1 putative amino-acid metabolite efflux pump [Granulosicoccus antarcticus IMCC3135]